MTKERMIQEIASGAPIRSLVWKEPFASLMLQGKIETRTWSTKYRGFVLICAGKTPYPLSSLFDLCGSYQLNRILGEKLLFKYGHAIAIGRLVDCRPMKREDEDSTFVRFVPESCLYCHVYEDVIPITPFPFKGHQGWRIQNGIEILNALNL